MTQKSDPHVVAENCEILKQEFMIDKYSQYLK
jgi:hypothetical protein